MYLFSNTIKMKTYLINIIKKIMTSPFLQIVKINLLVLIKYDIFFINLPLVFIIIVTNYAFISNKPVNAMSIHKSNNRYITKEILDSVVSDKKRVPGWPSTALRDKLRVKVATIEDKKIFQMSDKLQKLVTSSKLNRTPPEKINFIFTKQWKTAHFCILISINW